MKKVFAIIVSLVFICGQIPNTRATTQNNLVITEIAAYESTGFEWVEIYNRGESSIDVTAYKFWEGGVNHSFEVKQGSVLLGPKEFALIVQDDVKFKQQYPLVTSTILDSSWGSLNESGEEIGLKDAQGNSLEQFTYIAAPDFSLERKNTRVDEYTSANWTQHASGNTAGQKNSVDVPLPVQEQDPSVQEPEPQEEEIPEQTGLEDPLADESQGQESTTSTEQGQVQPENENQNIEEQNSTSTLQSATSTEPIRVRINEFLPQPNDGEKEWIELYNESSVSADIHGWTIEDGTGKIATVSSTPIDAQGFSVIELVSSKLNNSGDSIILKNLFGDVIHTVHYGDSEEQADGPVPKKANTLIFINNEWKETITPTKGSVNIFTPVPVQTQTTQQTQTQTTQTQNNTSIIAISPGTVVINEVYPNPPGSDTEDEFIELYNTSNTLVDLNGYKISDASTSFTLNQKIEPLSYLTLYRKLTHISLNNTGEERVKLTNGTTIIDELEFDIDASREAQSLNLTESKNTVWSVKITPNAKNIIQEKEEDEPIKRKESTTTSTTTNTATKENKIPQKNFNHIYQYLQITEIFPAPKNTNDEFIEIFNLSSTTLDISLFQIDDEEGGSRPFALPEGTMIEPLSFFVVGKKDSKISLNNSDDGARILDPNGKVVQEVLYEETEKDFSFALNEDDEWQWTGELTPGEENVFSGAVETEEQAKEKIVDTSIEKLDEFEPGQKVKVIGTVVVPPGILSSQYFYIATSRGVQVYMSKKDFPEIAVGYTIVVSGELSDFQGEPRIKIKSKEDIEKIGTKELVIEPLEISRMDQSLFGTLASVRGEVTEKKSGYMFVDDGTDEIEVVFKKGSGIDVKSIQLGNHVQVSGIVLSGKQGLQLVPRFPEDVHFIPFSTSSTEFATTTEAVVETSEGTNPLVVATTGGVGSLLLGFLAKIHGSRVLGFAKKYGGPVIGIVRKKKEDDIA